MADVDVFLNEEWPALGDSEALEKQLEQCTVRKTWQCLKSGNRALSQTQPRLSKRQLSAQPWWHKSTKTQKSLCIQAQRKNITNCSAGWVTQGEVRQNDSVWTPSASFFMPWWEILSLWWKTVRSDWANESKMGLGQKCPRRIHKITLRDHKNTEESIKYPSRKQRGNWKWARKMSFSRVCVKNCSINAEKSTFLGGLIVLNVSKNDKWSL